MEIDFPFHVDARGRTAATTHADHVRDLIEELLMTSPGERVNRPSFGSGLMQVVHEPARPELATATQMLVQGTLQQWLGDLIELESVDVTSEDALVEVTVIYRLRETGERKADIFRRAT